MAAKSNIDELKKEYRKLRERNAYLGDEVAYIKYLMEVMLTIMGKINLQRKRLKNDSIYIRSSITFH